MRKMYSSMEDCLLLAHSLKEKMGSKISFYGASQEVMSGTYFSSGSSWNSKTHSLEEGLLFYYKFCKGDFLRLGIGSNYTHQNSLGEKLAALSDFYEVLSLEYGEPTVFYTIKEDEKEFLTLQWSFVNQKEEIQNFENGTYFDDGEIDRLIMIGNQQKDSPLKDRTKKNLARQMGLPFELVDLANEDIEEFVKYKTGREVIVSQGDKMDGLPVVSFEKKLFLGRNRNI